MPASPSGMCCGLQPPVVLVAWAGGCWHQCFPNAAIPAGKGKFFQGAPTDVGMLLQPAQCHSLAVDLGGG